MTLSTTFDTADFRKRAARFRDWCTVAVFAIGAVLAWSHGVAPLLELLRAGDLRAFEVVNRLLRELAEAGPAILYACGLWALRQTFAGLVAGVRFEPTLARGIGAAGADLVWGAVVAVLLTPTVLEWTGGRPGGFAYDFNVGAVVIGFVGLAMALLARLLTRAAAQEAELGEII